MGDGRQARARAHEYLGAVSTTDSIFLGTVCLYVLADSATMGEVDE
jgi:hypothetical protein